MFLGAYEASLAHRLRLAITAETAVAYGFAPRPILGGKLRGQMNQAFAIEFELEGPVIIDRGINLSGLLARRIADAGDPDPLPKVPLLTIEGIFAGSDVFILGPVVDYHVAYVRSLRPTAMEHDLALRDKRGRPMPQITLRDEQKNLLDSRTATAAAALVAFGTGDLAEVIRILAGLDSIGAKRSGGFGSVTGLRVTPIDHPHAGFADRAGAPMRPVPVEVWRRMNLPPQPLRQRVARLPRWAAAPEPCVSPRSWAMDLDAFERELLG